jgi:hypothetical protein
MFGENIPYLYFSTFHWTKMVNGYSGHSPPSYARLAEASAGFPLGDTVSYMQQHGVTHVSLQGAFWHDEPCAVTMARLARDPRFRLMITTRWQGKPAQLYELTR